MEKTGTSIRYTWANADIYSYVHNRLISCVSGEEVLTPEFLSGCETKFGAESLDSRTVAL